jgi:hypothetical protein
MADMHIPHRSFFLFCVAKQAFNKATALWAMNERESRSP